MVNTHSRFNTKLRPTKLQWTSSHLKHHANKRTLYPYDITKLHNTNYTFFTSSTVCFEPSDDAFPILNGLADNVKTNMFKLINFDVNTSIISISCNKVLGEEKYRHLEHYNVCPRGSARRITLL